jgi:hypothetical protein
VLMAVQAPCSWCCSRCQPRRSRERTSDPSKSEIERFSQSNTWYLIYIPSNLAFLLKCFNWVSLTSFLCKYDY